MVVVAVSVLVHDAPLFTVTMVSEAVGVVLEGVVVLVARGTDVSEGEGLRTRLRG